MKAAFATLGCKVNQYDTQAMRELFENAGYETVDFDSDEAADVYVINTCTVTQTGDKKSRQMISRAHARSENACIIVTGCYSQRAPDEVLALPGVDIVIGTQERNRIVEIYEGMQRSREKVDAVTAFSRSEAFEELVSTREGRTRAHLKIQEGCDRFCTYCIIPYARGGIRSRPIESVREEFQKFDEAGYREVVLTGIHLMSYGRDFRDGTNLLDAIRASGGFDSIKRIRLGSLEPQMMSDDFVKALADDKRICRQFHLSLQSGSAGVLRRMARRYTPEEYLSCVASLRAAMPECAITTDIIVGFPGETEAEFMETLDFAKKARLARIHVFPYSRRAGTKAYDMPNQLSRTVKAERAARLIALGAELESEYLHGFVGRTEDVLFEEVKDGAAWGYTGTYARVGVTSFDKGIIGRIVPCRIVDECKDHLMGELI